MSGLARCGLTVNVAMQVTEQQFTILGLLLLHPSHGLGPGINVTM